jgi:hypothetical protein
MVAARCADTFVVRVRREPRTGEQLPSVERWEVEHVQTGLKVYVHDLDEAAAVIRSCLSAHREPRTRRSRRL